MNVFLTGGTGFIGSAVLARLIADGHSVTALVRSEESAQKVDAAGATHLMADILNTIDLAEGLAEYDAAIHLASPNDEGSPDVDRSIATAVANAWADTNKVYVHTGGVWVYGDGADITEQSPFNPPALTAWRRDVENIALSVQGLRTTIVEPPIVYGHGKGLPNVIVQGQKSDTGSLTMIGTGQQHWATVYIDDLADLYVRALTDGKQGYYIGASGLSPTVQEMSEAASRASGNGDVVAGTAESAAAAYGPMAEALLLDQQATGAKAKTELGWSPQGPSIIDELETGSYSPKS